MSASIDFLLGPAWPWVRVLLFLGGTAAFAGLNAAYLVWCERKIAAYVQRRPGPMEVGPQGLIQPIADAVKLLCKQLLTPPAVDTILYRIAPVAMIIPALMCFVVLPYGDALMPTRIDLGLLVVFAFSAINVISLMLAGWSSNNKYAIISSARVVSQNVAYEIPMLLTIVTLILVTGTTELGTIVGQQGGWFWNWNILRGIWTLANPLVPVSFLIFFICMLAETNRAPFDLAEAESELVAGSFTEYSSMGFGLFFMAEYVNIVVGCSLATVLFLGGWHTGLGNLLDFLPAWASALVGLGAFFVKLYALIFVVMWIRWTFPRTQFYGLLNLSWKILIPVALFTLLLSSVLVKLPNLF
ncbi:MAG TPA: NADH-quinone oxidoreductase subunit H [Opitutaceae bacterium]|nr:NADH-quinone oxidoreductase subunit H [Opitutaceae bacterium]